MSLSAGQERSRAGVPLQIRLRGRTLVVGAEGIFGAFWRRLAQGDWEPETFPVFERFIDPAHSYIDMGAWIGPTVLYGCQIARRVYAIEPDPVAYPELERNVRANLPVTANVQLVPVCIARRSGEVGFGNPGAGGNSISSLLFANRKMHWTVQALTFEELLRRYGIDDCNFIKMDIEGGEYQVLPTMREYLRTRRPTLYLSLHPCHLGTRRIGWPGKLIARVFATLRVLPTLRLFRHIYDGCGRPVSTRRILWRSCAHSTFELVLTDRDWSPEG